ncbi:hypothetical protein RN001_006691 [Aquatica leii]|uniref:Uncharacterized protein n=1 Tax=Aquatica leii TaxID=1421715 RepID=A0AAN7Q5T9_9COLE|nr:hypothetical protein RN001_006691 [Aquatica leii]
MFRLPKKGIDGSALPPCKSELYEHFLRSCYIAQLWSHAHLKVTITDEPSIYAWVEIDNRYELKWFSGSQLPTSINQITIQHETADFFFISIIISKVEEDNIKLIFNGNIIEQVENYTYLGIMINSTNDYTKKN